MELGQYPTASHCVALINGIHVDDIVRVEVSPSNPKIPLYGHHQAKMGMVAEGKHIVQGSITINYRVPGYLMFVLQGIHNTRSLAKIAANLDAQDKGKNPFRQGRSVQGLNDLISRLRTMNYQQRTMALAQISDPKEFDRVSLILQAIMDTTDFGKSGQIFMSPVFAHLGGSGRDMGFDLDVYFGTQGDLIEEGGSPPFQRSVRGVHLTGQTTVINNLATGGDLGSSGSPILEVYSFFARDATEQVLSQQEQTTV